MTTRKQYVGLLGGALVLAVVLGILAPAAQAAPFLTTYMEARVAGGSWGTVVAVVPGQAVEYRIMGLISPVGTANVKVGAGLAGTIGSLHKEGWFVVSPPSGDTTVSGVNGMKFNAYQTAANDIQVDFATAATMAGGTFSDGKAWSFGAGTGAGGGAPMPRAGGIGNDLGLIRPLLVTGMYVGVPSLNNPAPFQIASGSMGTAGAATKTDSKVLMQGYTDPATGSTTINTTMRVWNAATPSANKAVSEQVGWAATDPATVYNGITLYTPWAEASIISVIPPSPLDVSLGTGLAVGGAVGFSNHTTATYNWTIDGGLPIPTLTPDLALSNAELVALLGGLPMRTVNVALHMMTGDGAAASASTDVTLTPEPATMALLGLGLVTLLRRRMR
ncbi:MAG: PEP-CTERM sorting domain-containing protein [Planctomycetota bacterium]|nr:PEP-CTERM sorting domain-containing protein [Planctomycetota bacterium]